MNDSNPFDIYVWGVSLLPLIIFLARIGDVSLGTMRIIFLARGMKFVSSVLGFFEVLIWLMAVSQVIQNLTTPTMYIAYAAGYATGNYVGLLIERTLAIGTVMVRIITRRDASRLVERLQQDEFGITHLHVDDSLGKVHILLMVLKRRDLEDVLRITQEMHPQAFMTVEDVREARDAIFPSRRAKWWITPLMRK